MIVVQILPNLMVVGLYNPTPAVEVVANSFYWYFAGSAYLKKLLQHGIFPLYIYAISFLS